MKQKPYEQKVHPKFPRDPISETVPYLEDEASCNRDSETPLIAKSFTGRHWSMRQ